MNKGIKTFVLEKVLSPLQQVTITGVSIGSRSSYYFNKDNQTSVFEDIVAWRDHIRKESRRHSRLINHAPTQRQKLLEELTDIKRLVRHTKPTQGNLGSQYGYWVSEKERVEKEIQDLKKKKNV